MYNQWLLIHNSYIVQYLIIRSFFLPTYLYQQRINHLKRIQTIFEIYSLKISTLKGTCFTNAHPKLNATYADNKNETFLYKKSYMKTYILRNNNSIAMRVKTTLYDIKRKIVSS